MIILAPAFDKCCQHQKPIKAETNSATRVIFQNGLRKLGSWLGSSCNHNWLASISSSLYLAVLLPSEDQQNSIDKRSILYLCD